MKKKEYDKIASRLSQILYRLNNDESFTIEELAEEFKVSTRTIQRDINERLSFLPLEKHNGRYSLPSYYIGKLSFSNMKQFAVLSGVKDLYPVLDDAFITDILNIKINKAFHVNAQPHEDLSDKSDLFDEIGGAILSYKCLKFNYKEKPREVNPYRLLNTNGIWYLLADEGGVLKTFTFSKLKALKVSTKGFKPKEELLDQIRNNNAKWFSQNSVEVVLEIDGSIAEYFLRRALLPNQSIVEKTDEKLIVSTVVNYEEEILRTVRYWIPYIKILSPDTLADKLQEELLGYLKLY